MPIDPYSLCPGGTGKKVKFCCPDLVHELEKIQRMLEGEQRAACLEYIESIAGKYPDRACLMSIEAMLREQLGQPARAAEVLNRFLEKYPDNPAALAEYAMLKATQEGGRAAIEPLQRALEASGEQMPPQLYDGLGVVAEHLVAEGHILAARGHLIMQLAIAGGNDQHSLGLLLRLNSSSMVPLLLKQDLPLLPAPADAPYKRSFDKILGVALRGLWQQAATQFLELARAAGDWPAIWRNIATLRGWLADTAGTVEALRTYSAQKIPLEDAVEAEALAQLLDPEARETVDVVTIEYPITDIERLLAYLAASRQTARLSIDLTKLGSENEPPPRAAFWLLDRQVPETGVGIAPGDVPVVVGQVFVFGRQTDREARLELTTYRGEDYDKAEQALREVGRDALGSRGRENVSTKISALQHALSWNWRLPDDTPAEHRRTLITQQRREVLLNKWPRMPQRIFAGRSAADVAPDPAYRVRVLAAILGLELSPDQAGEFDFNELRSHLSSPINGPIDPTTISVPDLPLARLARLEVGKLSDDDLVYSYRRADQFRFTRALRKLALEVAARPSLDAKVDKSEVYGVLAQIETDSNVALGYVDQARTLAESKGRSSAPWDLVELSLRIARGEIAEADRIMQHIRTDHLREPGVAQALVGLLTEAGIIAPEAAPAAAAAAEAPGIVVPGAAAAETGKIWTPDSPSPSSGKKSTIWTPD